MKGPANPPADPAASPAPASASAETGPSAGRVHALIDRLVALYGDGEFRDEVAAAREDFFARAGQVFEDDTELFDRRIAAFLEWYVVERPLRGGPPPAVQALREQRFSGPEREALAWVAASHRSLFDITGVEGRTVEMADLLGGARFSVTERRSTIGFRPGDLCEARLVWNGRELVFGKTFLFHPQDARAEALDVVEALRAKGTEAGEIIFALARLHVRWHQLGHVGAARIYREGLIRNGG